MLLSGMLLVLDPALAIPIHGVVQLASNSTRLLVFLKHVRWRLTGLFAASSAVGAVLGAFVMAEVHDKAWLRLAIGVFILLATHAPKPKAAGSSSRTWIFAPVGAMAGFMGMLVGATGPLIAPFFLRENILKEELIATKATCQAFVHLWKIPLFYFIGERIGFAYSEHLPIIAALVAMVIVGTLTGRRIVKHVSEGLFVVLVKGALTLIALKLIFHDGLGLL